MRHFKMEFGKPGVTLTGYMHDKSPELPNGDYRPAILIFPGGGYCTCSDREAEPVALAFMAEGYQAFVLRYSVGPQMPFEESFKDANRAMKYLTDNAEDLQILPGKIAVCGFSAGGHLAAYTGVCGDIRPAAMILGYPVIMAELMTLMNKHALEIVDAVNGNTPPAYIFTTCTDEAVPVENSLNMAAALDRAGIPFEMHIFPDGPHGLSLAKPYTSAGKGYAVNEAAQKWFPECCRWLRYNVWGDPALDYEDKGVGMTLHEIGINTPLHVLMRREDCRAILLRVIPGIEEMLRVNPMMLLASVKLLHDSAPQFVTEEMVDAMAKELEPFD